MKKLKIIDIAVLACTFFAVFFLVLGLILQIKLLLQIGAVCFMSFIIIAFISNEKDAQKVFEEKQNKMNNPEKS